MSGNPILHNHSYPPPGLCSILFFLSHSSSTLPFLHPPILSLSALPPPHRIRNVTGLKVLTCSQSIEFPSPYQITATSITQSLHHAGRNEVFSTARPWHCTLCLAFYFFPLSFTFFFQKKKKKKAQGRYGRLVVKGRGMEMTLIRFERGAQW